ncbi:RNA-binding S4 domain-containing protein [Rhizobium sp. RU36D]|uniref:RNA-binding S4 domain-containing protein n=1 Tax=Rhizobium sp. RU36D TaxID=1907415 RepID=UPI0009D7CE1C|nr:RNA-binding S4 domain-containing protein [Rhizobium sp. RU36D]SMC76611.1 heat shock protein Hsp15 [Rhizobium sp. RU36D]
MVEKQPENGSRQRIDKWLFFARFFKSRSIAQEQVSQGRILVNDTKVTQPSHLLKSGDRLIISQERRDLIIVVRQAGTRRGPYEEAKLLYEDLTPPETPEDKLSRFDQATREPGAGRPTKKERRAIDRLMSDE